MFLHVDSESDQSRHWVHISFCWFCHALAQITFRQKDAVDNTVKEHKYLVTSKCDDYKICLCPDSFYQTKWGELSTKMGRTFNSA